jgi:hypothetical protein
MEQNTYQHGYEDGLVDGVTQEKLRVLGLIRDYIENDEADLDVLIETIAQE